METNEFYKRIDDLSVRAQLFDIDRPSGGFNFKQLVQSARFVIQHEAQTVVSMG